MSVTIREHEGFAHWVGCIMGASDGGKTQTAWYARCQVDMLRFGSLPRIPLDAPEATVMTCLLCLALPADSATPTAFAKDRGT